MSRCFPFPPPGYEQKTKTEIIDLSTKTKHREKKHKKEKSGNVKREHKERRDKDRSENKHKEKKDQKHKDRKKVNDDKRTSEDGKSDGRTESHNELHNKESWQKADEGKNSKFEKELGKRTRDVSAENPMVWSITNSIQRKFGVSAASPSLEKESVADSSVFLVPIGSVQRNDGSGLPIENVTSTLQRRTGCISTATAMEKERSKIHGCISSATVMKERKMHEKVTVGRGTEQSRNHGISRPMEGVSDFVNLKTESSTTGLEKEKCGERRLVSDSVVPGLERGKVPAKILASSSLAPTQRRKDLLDMSVENLSSVQGKIEVVGTPSLYSRIEDMGTVPTIEKMRAGGSEMFPHPVSLEQKNNTSIGQPVKNIYQAERKNKSQDKKADDRKGLKDSNHSEKDKDRHTKEEKNIVENAGDIGHNTLKNLGKKDQINTLNTKPLVPHKENTTGIVVVDGATKKRKDLDTNGYLQEKDERPAKLTKMSSSSQPRMNGNRSLELHLTAVSSLSLKSGAINNVRPDKFLENKESKINGSAISHKLPVELKPPADRGLIENFEISLELPHPDSKYLSQIYTVPKMEEWPEIDDQGWLCNCRNSWQKSKMEPVAEETPQVFSEALRIDSADVLALPYVLLF